MAHGVKSIEIRRWSTRQRGRVLIHAGRTPDAREDTWAHVPSGLGSFAQLQGGIVGEAQLVDCRVYNSREAFARDRPLHFNDPAWFQDPVMYGFVFAGARPLPFRSLPGSLYFFEVQEVPRPPAKVATTGLLVSVRSAAEALTALSGGADLIDVKEPNRGPLGRASGVVINDVIHQVAGRRPVSAALGELAESPSQRISRGLSFVKCGLANIGDGKYWQKGLIAFRQGIARLPQPPQVVTVAYADWKMAAAPPWWDVAKFALNDAGGVLLLDTFDKTRPANGQRSSTLLDWLKLEEIEKLCQQCHNAGIRIALAGSLRLPQILRLLPARPTWFAVRGGVCEANRRDGAVHVLKVRDLAELLRWQQRGTIAES